ncbi:uncharacterized protein LOC134847324 [Symsagittifera roscoffensis]|uniref:uncharacterized protein LOC134847324 n=1 Tax=Symsagittifera roscoffensis TaxID=84072 RepID=UPI00307BF875
MSKGFEMNYETRLNNRVDLDFPTWFETDRSQQNVVKFTLLSHWCYVKGAVINKVWQWAPEIFGESREFELLDISQHLMRSEISNSFFCNPYNKNDFTQSEVKVLTRREINQSREITTLNFVFGLPMTQVTYGKATTETIVHCLTVGTQLLPPDLEEIFLANQNAIVSHCKVIIDTFVKKFPEDSKVFPKEIQPAHYEFLKEEVRKVMGDIESMASKSHFQLAEEIKTYQLPLLKEFEDRGGRLKPFIKQALFSHFRSAFNTVVLGSESSKVNSMVAFLQHYLLEHEQDCRRLFDESIADLALFSHFRSAFNTVVLGSESSKVNSMVAFLQHYLLEHEQDCRRFCLKDNHERIMPFLPLQGIIRADSRKGILGSMEELFDRSSNAPNSMLIFYSKTPPVIVDVDRLSCWHVSSLREWSDMCENVRNNTKQKGLPPSMPFKEQKREHKNKEVDTHPWTNEHVERLMQLPESMKIPYMREFRNLMLRKALLLKRPVLEHKQKVEGVQIQSVKKLWWMEEHDNPVHNKDVALDTELLAGWLEHVCPTLGLYTLRTLPGNAIFEINM